MSVRKLFLYFLLIKLGYFLVAYFFACLGVHYPGDVYYKNLGTGSLNDLLNVLGRWDYGWYRNIALEGYDKINFKNYFTSQLPGWKQTNWGFMPLYPLILKVFNNFFMPETGAFVLSLIVSYFLVYAMFKLAVDYFEDESAAFKATLLFLIFPFNFYYSCFLTEPIFLTLVLFGFREMGKGNFKTVALLTTPLVILRPTGIFIFLLFYLAFCVKLITGNKPIISKESLVIHLWFLLPVLTFCAYLYYAYTITGDFFAYFTAQKMGWNKHIVAPFKSLFTAGSVENQVQSVYIIIFWIFSVIYLYKNPNRSVYFAFLMICSIPHLFGGNPDGTMRYLSGAFPLVFWFSTYIWKGKHFYRAISFLLLIFAHYASYFLWISNHKITM